MYFKGVPLLRRTFLFGLLFLQQACFHGDKLGGIMGYDRGKVFTGTKSFTVTPLPPPWKGPRRQYKELVFVNDPIAGTIVVDALCGPKFEDTSLATLARHLFYKLEQPRLKPSQDLQLSGREAIRVDGAGTMDGVGLQMAVVVMKKNFCNYDFVYFAPPNKFSEGVVDFKNFYESLQAP